ncbi:MAG: DivIVA domain-containing protein [Erysipelothrix sp.]|nr:DivIVA domain-containing protein [Erysipelothrix sp.]
MKDILKLSAEKIYEKEFSVEFKGYSPKEIDSFLDTVIKDYQIIDEITDEIIKDNRRLKYEVATLEAEIIELKAMLKVNDRKPEVSNIDILRRLARLEEIILNK